MDMRSHVIRRVAGRVLDAIYPPRCVSCRRPDAWWCADCRAGVERLEHDPCARCLSTRSGHVCAGTLPFAGVVSTGFYHSRPLRRLIAELKFQGLTAVGPDLEMYLSDGSGPFPWAGETSIAIQPMPLAPGRERQRGFNQAAWIAERMRVAWNIPGGRTALLARRASTFAQADLDHDGKLRKANISGTFVATRRVASPVLLVDDVVTTGSTAGEAAQVLLASGVPRVYLATLAVGK